MPKRLPGDFEEVMIPLKACLLSGLLGIGRRDSSREFEAIVLVHGFAAEKTEKGLFGQLAERLVNEGYTVLAYDWRGLGKSSGDFSSAGLRTHVQDLDHVTEWLMEREGIQRGRICAVGFSLGAVLVAKSIKRGGNFGASVFLSPAIRPSVDMWPRYNTFEARQKLRKRGFILKNDVKLGKPILRSLKSTDLGKDAFDLGVPLLVCHGTADSRIPIIRTRKMFQQRRNQDVSLVSRKRSHVNHSDAQLCG